jgi:hypothetical protein
MFFGSGLKNEIGQALKQEVPYYGREINVEILAVIFKLLRIVDDP